MPKKRRYYKNKRISKGELKIANYLSENNISFEREFTFSNLVSDKNKPLRFDFYILAFNLLIEYNGEHHYQPVNPYRRAKKVHSITVKHDTRKKEYCDLNKIRLLRIPYWEYDNIEEVLNTIISAFQKKIKG